MKIIYLYFVIFCFFTLGMMYNPSYAQLDEQAKYSILITDSSNKRYTIYLEFSLIDQKVSVLSSTVSFNNKDYFIDNWETTFYDKPDKIVFKGIGSKNGLTNARALFTLSSHHHGANPELIVSGILIAESNIAYIESNATILHSEKVFFPKPSKESESHLNSKKSTKNYNIKIVSDQTMRVKEYGHYGLTVRVYNETKYQDTLNIISPFQQTVGHLEKIDIKVKILDNTKNLVQEFRGKTNEHGFFDMSYFLPDNVRIGQYYTQIFAEDEFVEKTFFVLREDLDSKLNTGSTINQNKGKSDNDDNDNDDNDNDDNDNDDNDNDDNDNDDNDNDDNDNDDNDNDDD